MGHPKLLIAFILLATILISADGTPDEKFERVLFCCSLLIQYTSKFVFRAPA